MLLILSYPYAFLFLLLGNLLCLFTGNNVDVVFTWNCLEGYMQMINNDYLFMVLAGCG